MSENSSGSSGIGFAGLLQIAFIVLRLTKVITWSWWWVFAPTWITVIIAVVVIAAMFYFVKKGKI